MLIRLRIMLFLAVALLAGCPAAKRQPPIDETKLRHIETTMADIVNAVWLDRTPLRELRSAAAPTGAEAVAISGVRDAAVTVHNATRGLRFRAVVFMPLLEAGILGVAYDGTLVHRSALPPRYDAGEIANLLASENQDRRLLGQRMTAMNGLPASSAPVVEQIVTRAWRAAVKPGWWVESEPGSWQRR